MQWLSFKNASLRALVTFLLCFEVSSAETTRPEVTILQGTVKGVTLTTRNDRSIYGFREIPYAEPPIGSLRFKATVAAGGWKGTLDAGSGGSACIQSPNDMHFISIFAHRLDRCLRLSFNCILASVQFEGITANYV